MFITLHTYVYHIDCIFRWKAVFYQNAQAVLCSRKYHNSMRLEPCFRHCKLRRVGDLIILTALAKFIIFFNATSAQNKPTLSFTTLY